MAKSARGKLFVLGNILDSTKPLTVDISKLIVTRLLVQANSGGGKSYLIRRLLEQTHGKVQQIIIDVEGEFASLREKFDYIYASKERGDTTVDPRGAALLAERLLELKLSAILDIYELDQRDRVQFVKLFLDAMVNANKKLWHPVLVIVDEAHMFCPQVGESESKDAVTALLTRGRKRGFCAVLATQRLSKLHKDTAAECLNRFIGRTGLDVDVKRAAEDLGMDKDARRALRSLRPGQFFAFGPAMPTPVVTPMKVGEVKTRHPKAGARIKFTPPRPTARIKALLPKLADLPNESEQREVTTRQLKRDLTTAKAELAQLAKTKAPKTVSVLKDKDMRRLERLGAGIGETSKRLDTLAKSLSSMGQALTVHFLHLNTRPEHDNGATPAATSEIDLKAQPVPVRVLAAIKAAPGAVPEKLGALAHSPSRRSTFRLAISELRRKGYVRGDRHGFFLTAAGVKAAAPLPVPPTGPEAVLYWRRQLGEGVVRQVFDAVLDAGRQGLTRQDIERVTGVDTSISTFRLALGKLRSHGLVRGDSHKFEISPELL